MKYSPRIKDVDFTSRRQADRTGQIPSPDSPNLWVEQARQISSTVVEQMENSIRSRPLTSLGIAAGLGLLLAFWSKRK